MIKSEWILNARQKIKQNTGVVELSWNNENIQAPKVSSLSNLDYIQYLIFAIAVSINLSLESVSSKK